MSRAYIRKNEDQTVELLNHKKSFLESRVAKSLVKIETINGKLRAIELKREKKAFQEKLNQEPLRRETAA